MTNRPHTRDFVIGVIDTGRSNAEGQLVGFGAAGGKWKWEAAMTLFSSSPCCFYLEGTADSPAHPKAWGSHFQFFVKLPSISYFIFFNEKKARRLMKTNIVRQMQTLCSGHVLSINGRGDH